jgi:hypothetical protein
MVLSSLEFALLLAIEDTMPVFLGEAFLFESAGDVEVERPDRPIRHWARSHGQNCQVFSL